MNDKLKHRLPLVCDADTPWRFSRRDWLQVLKQTGLEIEKDNVAVIAAGVAFFSLLAVFPLITACLSIFGYFADTAAVEQQLSTISSLLPKEAWEILDAQIKAVTSAPERGLGFGILFGIALALYSAGSGIRAIMRAMNVAYGEREKRGFFQFYALAIGLTISVTLFMFASLAVIVGVPALLNFIHLEGAAQWLAQFMPWIILISIFAFATATLYRIGPSRRKAKFRWIIPGAIFATLAWMAMSAMFSLFVAEFSTYNKTYGSLSAVIILLVWFWLTAFVVIIGAELNAELERHTCVDTTRGAKRPIGARGAAMADYRHPIDPKAKIEASQPAETAPESDETEQSPIV